MKRFTYNKKRNEYDGCYNHYPVGGWNLTIDNDHDMLECPRCAGRVIVESYLLAVGAAGTRFCPYCGKQNVYYEGV